MYYLALLIQLPIICRRHNGESKSEAKQDYFLIRLEGKQQSVGVYLKCSNVLHHIAPFLVQLVLQ